MTVSGVKRANGPAEEAESGAKKAKSARDAERAVFADRFEDILEHVVKNLPVKGLSTTALERLRGMMRYNVPGGKLTRGLSVGETFKACVSPREPTTEEVNQLQILGWCVEWLQAAFLVADDVMDNSTMRRTKPCWYRVESVGVQAINDAFLLEGLVYHILRCHCRDQSWYLDVVELLHDVTLKTEIGQMLDLWVERERGQDSFPYQKYTKSMYDQIVVNKTAYYTFALPVLIGMHVAEAAKPEAVQEVNEICRELGRYFQMQDDYLDCFGDVATLGKVGTDIQEGKCSWLFVTALDKVEREDKDVLLACYGRDDPAQVEQVKDVYRRAGMKELYATECANKHTKLCKLIADASPLVPKHVFTYLLHKIHGRNK